MHQLLSNHTPGFGAAAKPFYDDMQRAYHGRIPLQTLQLSLLYLRCAVDFGSESTGYPVLLLYRPNGPS